MPNDPEKENYYEKPKSAPAKPADKSKPAPVMNGSAKIAAKTPPSGDPVNLHDLENRAKFREMGVLSRKMSPYKLVGKVWNSKTTFYYEKGKVFRGDRLDPKKVSPGTRVFIRK